MFDCLLILFLWVTIFLSSIDPFFFGFLLVQAAARKNALVMEYEKALQKLTLDLKEAEGTIKIKEAGLEAARKEKHDRDRELAAERGRYSRECRQAI